MVSWRCYSGLYPNFVEYYNHSCKQPYLKSRFLRWTSKYLGTLEWSLVWFCNFTLLLFKRVYSLPRATRDALVRNGISLVFRVHRNASVLFNCLHSFLFFTFRVNVAWMMSQNDVLIRIMVRWHNIVFCVFCFFQVFAVVISDTLTFNDF